MNNKRKRKKKKNLNVETTIRKALEDTGTGNSFLNRILTA
jgi:hypothetical protein